MEFARIQASEPGIRLVLRKCHAPLFLQVEKASRFELVCGAAHRLALAALRRECHRSENRITVFTLVHTLSTSAADIQNLLKAHNERNLAEYEGRMEIDEKLLADLTRGTKALETEVSKLDPPARD